MPRSPKSGWFTSQIGGRLARLRSGAPPATFALLLVASLMLRCAKTEPTPSLIGFQPGPVARGGSTGTGGASIATGGLSLGVGTGGQSAVTPPPSECTPATADHDCPLPTSACEGTSALAYYTSPACVYGRCQWTRLTTPCDRGCTDGGCAPAFTAVAAGNVDSGVECSSSDASTCALPASICMDATRLLYFSNPRCVAGQCQFEAHARDCSPDDCQNGGCRVHFTR